MRSVRRDPGQNHGQIRGFGRTNRPCAGCPASPAAVAASCCGAGLRRARPTAAPATHRPTSDQWSSQLLQPAPRACASRAARRPLPRFGAKSRTGHNSAADVPCCRAPPWCAACPWGPRIDDHGRRGCLCAGSLPAGRAGAAGVRWQVRPIRRQARQPGRQIHTAGTIRSVEEDRHGEACVACGCAYFFRVPFASLISLHVLTLRRPRPRGLQDVWRGVRCAICLRAVWPPPRRATLVRRRGLRALTCWQAACSRARRRRPRS